MNEKTDEELIKDIQRGNIIAFEEIVKRYQKRLFFFVYHITQDEKDAEEIIMDTLFNIYRTIERIDINRKFSTYIFEIAKNNAISYLRKRKYTVTLEEESLLYLDESIYEKLILQEEMDLLKKAINRLNLRYKLIINLYYFEDQSYEEISTKTNLPLNTVRTHLFRARVLLRKELKNGK